MHSSTVYQVLLLISAVNALPPPKSTAAPSLRKRVLVHKFPRRNKLQRRGEDGQTYVNLEAALKEFDHIDSKYTYHNDVYRKTQNATGVFKRDSRLLAAAAAVEAPFDLAGRKLGKRQVASVSLTDDVEGGVDVSYYSEQLNIGTPQQTFAIDFDTGSADLWVLGPDAAMSSTSSGSSSPFGPGTGSSSSGTSSADHAIFTPSASSSNTLSTTQFDITYGTGEIQGDVSQDVVELNGLSVEKQIFGVATSVSSDFIDSPFDGLMGLGFSSISQTEGHTWSENLVIDKSIASNLFSVQLGRGSESLSSSSSSGEVLNDESGEIIFGAIDSSAYSGNLVYTPVTTQAYWQVESDGAGQNGAIIPGTSFAAAIDTGTSLVYVPTDVASSIATAVGATSYRSSSSSTYYSLPCDTISNTNLALSFGGTQFQIVGDALNAGRISSRSDQCMFAIVGSNTNDPNGKPLAIVGDAFLSSVVAVFDYSNGVRVGMASQIGANSTSSTQNNASSNVSSGSRIVMSLALLLPLLLVIS